MTSSALQEEMRAMGQAAEFGGNLAEIEAVTTELDG